MNKYYVYHSGGKCEGPYKIREAMKEKEYWDNFGEYCRILKVIIDFNGKEVK